MTRTVKPPLITHTVVTRVQDQVWDQMGKVVKPDRFKIKTQVVNWVQRRVADQIAIRTGRSWRIQLGTKTFSPVWNQTWDQVRTQVWNNLWDQI